MKGQRQVDLGMGRGLQPGGLANKEATEAPDTAAPKAAPTTRRQRSVTAIDPASAIVVLDERLASTDSACVTMALQLQLDSALSEAEVLRQEVESYSKQVASKHSAVCILRQELNATAMQREELQIRNQELRNDLTKEINRLQFELEYAQNNLSDSQQTWSQRFDRVCQENQRLQQAMHCRDNELRFLVEERSGLLRDRDELLALLDSETRSEWLASAASPALAAPLATIGEGDNDIEACQPPPSPVLKSPEGRGAIEVAVLGACTCPGCSPCRCAQAAARLKRQVVRAREEAIEARRRAEDAYVVVDAYRNAFEEQLARNRGLTLRLGHANAAERGGRLRELVRWVGRQLSELGTAEPRRTSGELRRALTIDDVGLGGRSSPVASLNTSSWSICESVLSQSAGQEEASDLREMDVLEEGKNAEVSGMNAASQLTAEQLTMVLLDKLCERAEISAHQRLTARVLKRPGAACGGKRSAASNSSGVFSSSSAS